VYLLERSNSSDLTALGYHRSEESFKYLLSRADIGLENPRARQALIKAIRESAQWQEDRYKRMAADKLGNVKLQ
jgi:ABC-type nitrate/sulfonate/bicarbonate transport system substrate-binding protein